MAETQKHSRAQVQAAVEAGVTQYVILGAGYDTRAVRLRLPASVAIFEVDQPDVQKKKIAGDFSNPSSPLHPHPPSSISYLPLTSFSLPLVPSLLPLVLNLT